MQRLKLESFYHRWKGPWVADGWDPSGFPCGAECISGRCCRKDHQEGEPGTGLAKAAYPTELLCLFFSGGRGEPATTCTSLDMLRGGQITLRNELTYSRVPLIRVDRKTV